MVERQLKEETSITKGLGVVVYCALYLYICVLNFGTSECNTRNYGPYRYNQELSEGDHLGFRANKQL